MRRLRTRPDNWLSVLAILLLLTGCQDEKPARPETPAGVAGETASSTADRQRQRDLALAARQELFEQLSGRLMTVMAQQGPAAAIQVCRNEAPEITSQVGEKHGVAIGRTSFRLRNPQNSAPSWAGDWIEQRVEEPQFVDLPSGQLGALLPIRLQPLCLLCHGPEEQIDPGVKQALAQNYPNDQATGFAVDELRGWFWIEVPAAAGQVENDGA